MGVLGTHSRDVYGHTLSEFSTSTERLLASHLPPRNLPTVTQWPLFRAECDLRIDACSAERRQPTRQGGDAHERE